jgi:hypothetical protein
LDLPLSVSFYIGIDNDGFVRILSAFIGLKEKNYSRVYILTGSATDGKLLILLFLT